MGHPPRILSAGLFACLILLYFSPAFASPTCKVGCHGLQPGKGYKEGATYVYDFEGTAVTSLLENQSQSTATLKAGVELTVKPNCLRQLRIKNAQLNGAPVQLKDVEQYALQFNYHDGHVDSEICAEPGDSQASLNIKRAVASLFQSAIMQESGSTTHFETDVFGGCVTDFQFRKDGEDLVVKKERNLNNCRNRETMRDVLISAVYDPASPIQSNPVLDADYKSEQKFKDGVLNLATTEETYLFEPSSSSHSSAKTTVKTSLTFKSQKGDNPDAKVSLPKSLIFEAPHPVTKSSADDILAALKKVKEEEPEEGVKAMAAQRFSELTKVLRRSNKKDISAAYQKVKSDKSNRKALLDALYKTGTGEAAEFVVELIKSKELSPMGALYFYMSLVMVRHVNLQSLSTVTTLLDEPDLPRIGYLGVGQIIGKYCQEHDCENVPEVKKAVAKIVSKVGNGKADNRKKENEIVAALKGLGNTRYIPDEDIKKIVAVATDKKVRNRVRAAAIESLATRCSGLWKSALGDLYGDYEEDSEIRIKSYLSIVNCACSKTAEKISSVLDAEKSNQVGSFVSSHLTNLRASADPNKAAAKHELGQIYPKKKFPRDHRKFSFNREMSYNFPSFGTGESLESNVIYSQNSFMPRSISLNYTTEMFGRSFNLFELESRIENLDQLIEHWFGPMGEILRRDPKDLAKAGSEKLKSTSEYIQSKIEKLRRQKREVKHADLEKFAKGVALQDNEVDNNLDVDMSLKLFGVEYAFLSIEEPSHKITPEKIIDKVFEAVESGMHMVKDFNKNIEYHLQFLDTESVYPSGLGLPLVMGAVGSGVVHVKTSGKIDIPAILKDPKNAVVKIAMEPSVSARVSAFLGIEGLEPKLESGLKYVVVLHSSTGSDLTVKLLDGKGVDVNLAIPKKKQELISLEASVAVHNGKEWVSPKVAKVKEQSDCFDQFSPIIGLTVCGQLSYPSVESDKKSSIPLSGPIKFGVTLENNDVSSYHFRAFYDTKKAKERSLEILFETPNSRTNRKVSLLIEGATEPDKYAKVSLDSPIKKASAEGRLKNTAQEKSLQLKVSNDQDEYHIKAGLMANGNKYKPILEYSLPDVLNIDGKKSDGKQTYNLDGTVDVAEVDGGKKFSFEKIALKAAGRDVASLDGSVTSTPKYVNADLNLGYGPEKIAVKVDGKKVNDNKYTLELSGVPSKNPEVGFAVQYELEADKGKRDQKLVITHGADLKSEVNRFTFEEHAVYNLDPASFVISNDRKIKYPAGNFDMKLKYGLTPKSIEGDLEFQYDKFKFGTELEAKTGVKKPGDYEAKFEVEVLNNKLDVRSKREIVDEHKSKYSNSLEMVPGGKYTSDVTVFYNVEGMNNIGVQIDGDINANGKKVKVNAELDKKPQKLNSKALFSVDGNKYLDFNLAVDRAAAVSTGKLDLNLKNYVIANGQFNYQGGKGNGQLTAEIPSVKRKIKVSGDVQVAGTKHTANVELLYNADVDPNKRVKLSTVTDLTKTSIDSKNVIEILAYKFEVNGNGKIQGKPFVDGQVQGQMDVTMPNGRHLAAKGKYDVKRKGTSVDYIPEFELIDSVKKGGESQKLSYSGEAKDVDPKTMTYKGKHKMKYVHFNGKDLDAQVDIKMLPSKEPGRRNGELKVVVDGGIMQSSGLVSGKFQLDGNADVGKEWSNWDVKSSLGNNLAMNSNGKYVKGEPGVKPYNLDSTLEMKLPSSKLKNFKIESHDTLMMPADAKGELDHKHKKVLSYNDDKKFVFESEVQKKGVVDLDHSSNGKIKAMLSINDKPPYGFDSYYKHDVHPDKKHSLNFGTKLSPVDASGDFEFTRNPEWTDIEFKAKGKSTVPHLKTFELDLKHKNEKDLKLRKTEINLSAEDKKYGLKSEMKFDPAAPSIEVAISSPEGVTEIKSKGEKLGEKEYKSSSSIKGPKGFVTLDTHVKLESEDNFLVEVDIDSNKLKQRKIHAEVAGTANPKNGKRIHVTVTSDGKNLLSGSMNFNKREEDGKVIIDGTGELKVMDATRSSSFKYSRQRLTTEKHGEQGVFSTLHANFDPSAIVSEMKFTDKEALFFGSYCEKSKDCTQMKLQSKLDTDKKTKLNHQITVEANLRKLNVPLEFGFRSNMKYEKYSYDHLADLYLHSTKDKSEYGYHAYWNMKESGVVFNTPNREMALISTHEFPKSKHTGAYKMETALYLDRKNKPNDKTGVMLNGDVNIEKSMLSVNGEAKFVYPSQPKDMVIKGKLHSGGDNFLDANLDIDMFAKKTQKINVVAKIMKAQIPKGYNVSSTLEITSKGQQLRVERNAHLALSPTEVKFGSMLSYNDIKQNPKTIGVMFSANLKEAHFLVQGPNQDLIKADSKMEFTKNLQKIDSEIKVLDNPAALINFEAKDWNSVNFAYAHKDAPNDKLTATGRVVLGQLTEFHANNVVKGDKKNLVSLLVHLDENKFLKPEFSYDKDNIVAVGEHYRNHLIEYSKQLKEVSKKLGDEAITEFKDLFEHLKKAQPNFKPLVDYYQAELQKLKDELHADATVQEIEAVLKKTFGALFEVIAENVKQMAARIEELNKELYEFAQKLYDVMATSVYPQAMASLELIMKSWQQIMEAMTNLGLTYFKALFNIINEHQKELKEIVTVASELAQDVAKMFFKAYTQIEKDLRDLVVLWAQQLKALPVYDIIKEKYQEALQFQIPEPVLSPIKELYEYLKNILPTKELKDFVEITHDYLMKVIKKQKVDDSNELKKIYQHAVAAMRSIIELLQNKITFDSVIDLFDTKLDADLSFFKNLPGLANLRISALNLIYNGELPGLADFYYAYRPTLRFLDLVPPFGMSATIGNGGHIFTFDGRHITMHGSCNYILAQDMRDGNFSVVAELNNGNLLGVTVTDPKESITVKPKGVILYNNKPADFPLNTEDRSKHLQAFMINPTVNVKSSYGLHMICTNTEELLCNLHVSGFYLGKLRGLFGDGNNEPYDDFTLPSGKITESDTEFANAYKLNPSCPDVAPMKHEGIARAPVCTDYFSGYSTMSKCFNYVDPSNYRHGCDHAVVAGDKNGPCTIAIAYYAACREKRVAVSIPQACMKCQVGSNDVTVGDSFSVKIPKKAADIIFVVEQETNNEKVYKELIVPLISELKSELKQQGMTDVYTGLIGFADKMRWPQHYTLNGNLNVDGEAKNMKFVDKDKLVGFEEAKKGDAKTFAKFLKQRLDVELGTFRLTDAYEQAIKYPFRAGSAKAVVGVLVSPCEKSPFLLSLQHLRLLIGQKTYRDLGLTYYHMFNTGELQVDGKDQKNVVGYDRSGSYTYADAKKKPLDGSGSSKGLAVSNNDVCANFAVNSGGAAFSTKTFLDSKPNQRKQYIQVVARRIAEDLANLELEEDCSCVEKHGVVGRPCCKIVNRKEKEQRLKKA